MSRHTRVFLDGCIRFLQQDAIDCFNYVHGFDESAPPDEFAHQHPVATVVPRAAQRKRDFVNSMIDALDAASTMCGRGQTYFDLLRRASKRPDAFETAVWLMAAFCMVFVRTGDMLELIEHAYDMQNVDDEENATLLREIRRNHALVDKNFAHKLFATVEDECEWFMYMLDPDFPSGVVINGPIATVEVMRNASVKTLQRMGFTGLD
jgi:hypothetical protein